MLFFSLNIQHFCLPSLLATSTSAFGNSFDQTNKDTFVATGQKPSFNATKYRAEFTFDASRDDELSIKVGDIINVIEDTKFMRLRQVLLLHFFYLIKLINIEFFLLKLKVDLSVKTDEGWLWGECQGRIGVFPAGFTVKISDLEWVPFQINWNLKKKVSI